MTMPTILTAGSSRTVILTQRWAIKLPGAWAYPGYRWTSLLRGLLHNMEERAFSRLGWPCLCPVHFALPGGLLIVMPRARPLSRQAWLALDYRRFFAAHGIQPLAEEKIDSFGIYDGRVVAVDYAGER